MKQKQNKGFTLIEILIVVAIIAILASVVLVGLGPTQEQGRDARRISDLREVQTGLELYFSKCGYYPGTADCAASTEQNTWAELTSALTGSDIGVSTVPNDPTTGKNYYYDQCNSGTSYVMAAQFENVNNSVFNGYTAPSTSGCPTPPTGPSGNACGAGGLYCLTL